MTPNNADRISATVIGISTWIFVWAVSFFLFPLLFVWMTVMSGTWLFLFLTGKLR